MTDKLEIVKKAYSVDHDKSYASSHYYTLATSAIQARSKLWKMIEPPEFILLLNDSIATKDTLPVVRYPIQDIVMFEGEEYSRVKVYHILGDRKRLADLDSILANEGIKYCYIKKNGYYYRPGAKGYVEDFVDAGIFTKEEAIDHAKGCLSIEVIPVVIDNHNAEILNRINDLQSKLIQSI